MIWDRDFLSTDLQFGNWHLKYVLLLCCSKAIRLYLQNLCYNPSGFDSWAGLALARSRKIMEKLNMASFGVLKAHSLACCCLSRADFVNCSVMSGLG